MKGEVGERDITTQGDQGNPQGKEEGRQSRAGGGRVGIAAHKGNRRGPRKGGDQGKKKGKPKSPVSRGSRGIKRDTPPNPRKKEGQEAATKGDTYRRRGEGGR